MFETGFSGANTQRFKLDERFDEIQRGSTGFISNPPPAPVAATTTATGKSVFEKQPVLQPPPENRWDVWANGWGDWVNVDDDGRAKGYNFTTGGFLAGVDYRLTDHFAVGLMGGYSHTATSLQPSGDIDLNSGRGGLYALYFDHAFYVNAAAYGGYNKYSTSRQALLGNANGSTNSGEFSTWTEAGYDFHWGISRSALSGRFNIRSCTSMDSANKVHCYHCKSIRIRKPPLERILVRGLLILGILGKSWSFQL